MMRGIRLFRPRYRHPEPEKRRLEIPKITSQQVLAEIANYDPVQDIRVLAIQRLTDQKLIGDIARSNAEVAVRLEAIKRLTDADRLSDLVRTDKSADVRQHAIRRITDQSMLAAVARLDQAAKVRQTAIEILEDSPTLKHIAETDEIAAVRHAALKKAMGLASLESQGDSVWLLDIAKTHPSEELRQFAITRLPLEQLYRFVLEAPEKMAIHDYHGSREADISWLRREALNRIHDAGVLAKLAVNLGNNFSLIGAVLDRIESLATLQTLADTSSNWAVCRSATNRLARIRGEKIDNRIALQKLNSDFTDQEVVEIFHFESGNDWEVALAAFAKIRHLKAAITAYGLCRQNWRADEIKQLIISKWTDDQSLYEIYFRTRIVHALENELIEVSNKINEQGILGKIALLQQERAFPQVVCRLQDEAVLMRLAIAFGHSEAAQRLENPVLLWQVLRTASPYNSAVKGSNNWAARREAARKLSAFVGDVAYPFAHKPRADTNAVQDSVAIKRLFHLIDTYRAAPTESRQLRAREIEEHIVFMQATNISFESTVRGSDLLGNDILISLDSKLESSPLPVELLVTFLNLGVVPGPYLFLRLVARTTTEDFNLLDCSTLSPAMKCLILLVATGVRFASSPPDGGGLSDKLQERHCELMNLFLVMLQSTPEPVRRILAKEILADIEKA